MANLGHNLGHCLRALVVQSANGDLGASDGPETNEITSDTIDRLNLPGFTQMDPRRSSSTSPPPKAAFPPPFKHINSTQIHSTRNPKESSEIKLGQTQESGKLHAAAHTHV